MLLRSRKIKTVIAKELQLYFNSAMAYIVISSFLLICGFFFANPLFVINYATVRHFLDVLPLILMFFIPAITMRIYSEEYKSGTIEIMYTLPFSKLEILIGKYLSSLFVIIAALSLTLLYPISLLLLGRIDIGAVISGYIGVFLLSMMYNSIGILGSSLTKNQIISFIISFIIIFAFFVLGKLKMIFPASISYLGIDMHFENFIQGILDFRDIAYFLSISFLTLYTTYLVIERER